MQLNNAIMMIRPWLIVLLISGCASAPYAPVGIESVDFKSRAETQGENDVTVTAAVLSPEETQTVFGLDLYARGIQPVWLEIQNKGASQVRYAPVGTDREYFSSQEVAYVHRSGFSKDAQRKMNFYFHELSMQRRIPAGESKSGFVFTHAHPGTKGFNVDVFGADREEDSSFTFFLEVPGFQPDHSSTYLTELYPPEQIQHVSASEIRETLMNIKRITTDETAEHAGVPINVVVVAEAEDFLQALIRSGWKEHPRPAGELAAYTDYFDGRIADIVFTKNERPSGERMELRIWLSRSREGNKSIWVAQVLHFIGIGNGRRQLDPDLDDASTFILQDLWYGQGIAQFGWVRGPAAGSFDTPHKTFTGAEYFSTGGMVVMWLSGPPVSMLEVQALNWDASPRGRVE